MADPTDNRSWLVKATQWFFDGLVSPLVWVLDGPRRREAWYAMNAANIVSVLRGLGSLPVIVGLWMATPGYWLHIYTGLFVALVLSDGIDGALCRGLKIHSKFGTLIDALADKLLLIGVIVALCQNYHSLLFTLATGMLITVELGNAFVGYLSGRLVKEEKQEDGHTNWGKWKAGAEILKAILGLVALNWPEFKLAMLTTSLAIYPFSFGLAVMSLRSYISKYTSYKAELLAKAA